MFIIFDNSVIYVRLYICIASYVANIVKYYMWLDLWKPIQITQELKSIWLPNIKAALLHYPDVPSTWLKMAKSAFTEGLLPTL